MISITENFLLALRNIIRNKTRTILTMLGIIIGVAAVILLVSLGQGLQNYLTSQFENLGTNLIVIVPGRFSPESGNILQGPPNFAGSKLELRHAEDISKLGPPVLGAEAALEIPASVSFGDNSKYTTVAGISTGYMEMRNLSVSAGRKFNKSDEELRRRVVVLGKNVKDELFANKNAVGEKVTIGGEKFEVIGVLSELGAQNIGFPVDNFALIPITSAQNLFGIDSVFAIIVRANSKDEVQDVISMIKSYMSKRFKEDDFSVVDQSSILQTINQILRVLTSALGGIAAISLIVGGVGIMNIMLVTVTERTREIGLRKAVGATQTDILIQFLVESVSLSLVGGILGVLLGSIGAYFINKFFPAILTFWSIALAFGVSAVIGIIFGTAPAIRASRLDPIEALRYE